MALATSLAAARVAMTLAVAVAVSVPILPGEQVYIWRDPSGTVRFSAVEAPAQPKDLRQTDSGAVRTQCTAPELVDNQ